MTFGSLKFFKLILGYRCEFYSFCLPIHALTAFSASPWGCDVNHRFSMHLGLFPEFLLPPTVYLYTRASEPCLLWKLCGAPPRPAAFHGLTILGISVLFLCVDFPHESWNHSTNNQKTTCCYFGFHHIIVINYLYILNCDAYSGFSLSNCTDQVPPT